MVVKLNWKRAGDSSVAQLVAFLPPVHEALDSVPLKLGVVVHACNSSILDCRKGIRVRSLRLFLLT